MENKKKYPGIAKSFFLLALFYVIYLASVFIISFALEFFEIFIAKFRGEDVDLFTLEQGTEIFTEYSAFISAIVIIVPTIIIARIILQKRETTLKDLLLKNIDKVNGKLLLMLGITTFVFILFTSYTSSIIMIIFDLSEAFLERAETMIDVRGLQGLFLLLIVAPIAEEILFRGLFLEGIASQHSQKVAILVSAFMFSLYHMNLLQTLHTFILGLFLAYVYLKTRSLVLCIYIHFVNNFFPYIISHLQIPEELAGETEMSMTITTPELMFYAFIIIILIYCLMYLNNYFKNQENDIDDDSFDDEGSNIVI
ncbi:MAG: CPBP family intramembrane glutamic endopeptidase [Halanaerobiales bacterium]